jgi:soluble lytic murein transglycosylase-like protein
VRPSVDLSEFTALALVEREALACGINPALARALLMEESHRDQTAVSKAGAIGLMQVMPFNAKLCGLTPEDLRENTVKNIRCGMSIFCDYMRGQGFDPWRALQEYNGGAKCINKCAESIKHAQKVLKRMSKDVS